MTQYEPQTGHSGPQTGLPAELLLDYATGAAAEPVALAVATYLDMNPDDTATYRLLNALGGALIEEIEPAAVSDAGLADILKRIDMIPVEPRQISLPANQNCPVPQPLHPYIGRSWDNLRWKTITSGVEEYVIATAHRGWRTSLLRIAPGKAMPTHTHAGNEYTLVLDGAYSDEAGSFVRGSFEAADPSVTHKPVADPAQGCVCLAVLSAPVQLTGFFGWFVNPFLRH